MKIPKEDEIFMRRCLQLALMAEGQTFPNPMVGSVIVHKGKIIGEGYHSKAGQPHAEVNAINKVKDHELLKASTLYVNLEPCAHHGKTPPCSKLIIDKKIPRVIIGCQDTYSEVAGKGIQMMRDAGIEVSVGVLEKESRYLNRRFFTYHEKKRPYIILKWAQTIDGFIDIERDETYHGQPTWITNEYARQAVHKLRATEQAIMIGTNTALKDNPSLNVRDWNGSHPLRIVIDKELKLPQALNLFDQSNPTLVVTHQEKKSINNLNYLTISKDLDLMSQVLIYLYKQGIQSLIIEGGATLLNSVIQNNIWDEAHVYNGDCTFFKGVRAPVIKGHLDETVHFGESKLYIYRNISLI